MFLLKILRQYRIAVGNVRSPSLHLDIHVTKLIDYCTYKTISYPDRVSHLEKHINLIFAVNYENRPTS